MSSNVIAPRTWRLLALLAPSLIVPLVASNHDAGRVSFATGVALSVLWLVVATALLVRFVFALQAQFRSRDAASPWDRIDVLTSSGAAMMWLGLVALVAASATGWASLGVVGVLGVGTVSVAALWTILFAAGDGPWQRAQVLRAVLPAVATEGEPLREEITLRDLSIPPGMRLFIQGRAQRHGAMSRYVVDGGPSGEVVLRAELGPALRGEHQVPPLALWFADVLGLTRTAVVHRGATELAVMPRQLKVDGAKSLLGEGGDDANAKQTQKMPTEGTFRIRAYTPGDDARRIHWVRSLQQDQLIVRLPDEIPPADPTVRLVLDNELFGTETLTCRAPDDMLDVLVRVWLGIAKELAAQGTRVTLVAAVDGKICERPMHPRSAQPALRFGARIEWQAALPLERVVGERRDKHVIVSARPRRTIGDKSQTGWVVVPEVAWTAHEGPLPNDKATRYAYPIGSPENRRSRRERERDLAITRWQDRAVFSQVMCWIDWSRFSGDHVARPREGRDGHAELEMIP
ncbi:MAG TPA: DUF58 domain-containing protein [Kofleriaceae bacterium]